jgi:threonine/homoserine/homoserine lactone efflux protein
LDQEAMLMDGLVLWKGLLLGFSIAAPVGPIGVLCIRRSLAAGFGSGFASGLGAATADGLYGLVAGLGLTAVSHLLLAAGGWLRLGGGLLLLLLGVRTFVAAPAPPAAPRDEGPAGAPPVLGLAQAYASTFALTVSNPATILSFLAAFGALGLTSRGAAGSLVAGVFLGSAAWWLTLSGATSRLRGRLGPGALTWINRLSGVVIGGFGLVALAAALWRPAP